MTAAVPGAASVLAPLAPSGGDLVAIDAQSLGATLATFASDSSGLALVSATAVGTSAGADVAVPALIAPGDVAGTAGPS
jgi:hypothetical protein